MEPARALREPQHRRRPASTARAARTAGRSSGLARVTGLLYLVLAVFGMFSAIMLESLVVPGDARGHGRQHPRRAVAVRRQSRGLAGGPRRRCCRRGHPLPAAQAGQPRALAPRGSLPPRLCGVLGAVLLNLYDAFRLLTGAGARRVSTRKRQTMALAALETFSAGFLLALVLFGVHLLLLGFLLYRSRYVPRVLGVLLVAAGVATSSTAWPGSCSPTMAGW